MQKLNATRNALSLAVMSLVTAGALTTSPALQADNHQLEEVIVTAAKREQSISELPMSVSVLSGEDLERQQADNFQDLMAMIPGFSVTSSQRGASRITLRGINTGGVASTVGVYVGDVPFGSSTGLANGAILSGDFDTFDMARVEVLRGPQGTLYGASSLGGVLKYVPNDPAMDGTEVRLKVSTESVQHGGNGTAVTGVVNIPIGDSLAIRASAFSRQDDGFINSIGNNPIPELLDPSATLIAGTQVADGLNDLDTSGGRVAIHFAPSETFALTISSLTQDIESGAPDVIDADAATLNPLNNRPVQSRYQDAYSNFEYTINSVDFDWDLGLFTLQSVTSDADFEQNFQQDAALATSLAGVPLSSYLSFALGLPMSAVLPQTTSTEKQSQEFRLISPDSDTFEWLVGAYYTEEESLISQEILGVTIGTDTPIAGLPSLATAAIFSDYEELAFFANATWYLSPSLELTVGARRSENKQRGRQVTSGPLAGDSDFTVDSKETPVTWSISPRYVLSDTSSMYLRIATGFRPGGPNVVPAFAPDSVPRKYDSDQLTNYEVGYRSESADGSFAFDVAAYYLDWEDVQLFVNVDGFGANANGGTAKSQGLEVQASFLPVAGLSVAVNGAYTNATLTEDTDAAVGGTDGDRLPFVPKWSGSVTADYEWAGFGGDAYVGGSFSYTGTRPAQFNNRDPQGRVREAGSYSLLNLRAGVDFGSWSIEVFGKNLTAEEGITSILNGDEGYTGAVELGLIRPRTFGISLGLEL